MTVLISDAKSMLAASGAQLSPKVLVNELLYADDTLLVDVDKDCIDAYMGCVGRAGRACGLAFNWKKLEVLSLGGACQLFTPEGAEIKQKQNLLYLGCILSADGSSGTELSRRLGAAKNEFEKIRRVWGHSCISVTRKIKIFNACVVSKLMYNLHSLWLSVAETRKIDAFHVKCLRQILKIQPSFYSRISNETVLQRARSRAMSNILLERQLLLMGSLAIRADSDHLKRSIFDTSSQHFQPKSAAGPKRRGRPKISWPNGVFAHAVKAAGSHDSLTNLWSSMNASKAAWKRAVHQYCQA